MLKVNNNWYKIAAYRSAPLPEIYDFFDDETIDNYYDYENNPPTVLDYDELPIVEEDNIDEYLVDNTQDANISEEVTESIEEPIEVTEDKIPEFANTQDALQWAINNNSVLKINYHPEGRKRRNGKKLRREIGLPSGSSITRVIEPHSLFTAGTGNLIVVTYDRSIREIRAFIVKNIFNYIFTGKEFKKKMKIIPSQGKRITDMNNKTIENLTGIGTQLTEEGFPGSADIVNQAVSSLVNMKTAQYVGIQGYWLKNRRCWDNCYRNKRATQPDSSAQKVWMTCWEEYVDSINNTNSDWEKYATDLKHIKLSAKTNIEQDMFIKKVSFKISQGISHGEAIYDTIDEGYHKYENEVFKNVNSLLDLAEILQKNNFHKLSKKISDASFEVIKEAAMEEKARWWQPLKKIKRQMGLGNKQRVIERLQNITRRAQEIIEGAGRPDVGESEMQAANQVQTDSNNRVKQAAEGDIGGPGMDDTAPPTVVQPKPRSEYAQQLRAKLVKFNQDLTEEWGQLSNLKNEKDPLVNNGIDMVLRAINAYNMDVRETMQMPARGQTRFIMNSLSLLVTSVSTAIEEINKIPEPATVPGIETKEPGVEQPVTTTEFPMSNWQDLMKHLIAMGEAQGMSLEEITSMASSASGSMRRAVEKKRKEQTRNEVTGELVEPVQ